MNSFHFAGRGHLKVCDSYEHLDTGHISSPGPWRIQVLPTLFPTVHVHHGSQGQHMEVFTCKLTHHTG